MTNQDVQNVVDWLNTWDQLRDGVIPIRFKEHFTRVQMPPFLPPTMHYGSLPHWKQRLAEKFGYKHFSEMNTGEISIAEWIEEHVISQLEKQIREK